MTRAIHGAPAAALRQALEALAQLSFWISWTADPDLAPEPVVSARCMRDAANALRKAAGLLDQAADRADPPPQTARRAAAPVSGASPDDPSGGGAGRPTAGTGAAQEQQPEAETSPARAGACRPERAASAPEAADAQLIASIKSHGLLENLTVYRLTWMRLARHGVILVP